MFENILIDHVIARQNTIEDIDNDDNEHRMYRRFLGYFSDINGPLEEKHLIDGACLAYAWMPTILNFKTQQFAESIVVLNQARGEESIDRTQLDTLARLINNSIVGASKLLHFINPKQYAIWDSRVCKCLTGEDGEVTSIDAYVDYLAMCKRITNQINYEPLHESYEQQVGYAVTPMRSIEQYFFYSNNNPI